MVKGGTLMNIGGVTLLVSLAGYLGACIFALYRHFTNHHADADAMAVALVGFLLGLLLLALGWLLDEYQRRKARSP